MKVLIITPIYEIKGRENLFHDSSAVHYLVKYWPKEAEVLVVYTYFNSIKAITRYLKKEERDYYRNNYSYNVDGVEVRMIETQMPPRQKKLNFVQCNRITRKIKKLLIEESFRPDTIICHIPSYRSVQFIDSLTADNKIAVLHYTDVKLAERDTKYIEELNTKFDHVYTRSLALYRYFQKAGVKNISSNIIQSGVNPPHIEINRDWSETKERPIRLLYVGKLIERKHVDYIISAIAELENPYEVEFSIVGNGVEKEKLIKLVEHYNLGEIVHFYNPVPHDEVFNFMRDADVFIMPSTAETLGLVYLEAMAMGCISVGTKNEGIDGIIQDDNGFLIYPSIDGVKHVLNIILSMDYVKLDEMSRKAIDTANNMTEQKMGIQYFEYVKRS